MEREKICAHSYIAFESLLQILNPELILTSTPHYVAPQTGDSGEEVVVDNCVRKGEDPAILAHQCSPPYSPFHDISRP